MTQNVSHTISMQYPIRVEVPDSCPDFKGRAISGFRPELHSRAESLSLESLEMSRAVGRENLDIPSLELRMNFEKKLE